MDIKAVVLESAKLLGINEKHDSPGSKDLVAVFEAAATYGSGKVLDTQLNVGRAYAVLLKTYAKAFSLGKAKDIQTFKDRITDKNIDLSGLIERKPDDKPADVSAAVNKAGIEAGTLDMLIVRCKDATFEAIEADINALNPYLKAGGVIALWHGANSQGGAQTATAIKEGKLVGKPSEPVFTSKGPLGVVMFVKQ